MFCFAATYAEASTKLHIAEVTSNLDSDTDEGQHRKRKAKSLLLPGEEDTEESRPIKTGKKEVRKGSMIEYPSLSIFTEPTSKSQNSSSSSFSSDFVSPLKTKPRSPTKTKPKSPTKMETSNFSRGSSGLISNNDAGNI